MNNSYLIEISTNGEVWESIRVSDKLRAEQRYEREIKDINTLADGSKISLSDNTGKVLKFKVKLDKPKKESLKEYRRKCFIDQIKEARSYALSKDLENTEDGGTMNLDALLVKKESGFTYDEFIQIFKDAGCAGGCKMDGIYCGYIMVYDSIGNANRRTRYIKNMLTVLEDGGFVCSIYYQMD